MTALLLCLLLAVPPLTEAQRALAEQTTDYAGFDEPGLYALLADAMTWEPGDESGARLPDYAALFETPSAHRGELFLLEGRFAGRSRRVGLANPGRHGSQATEWVILTRDHPDDVAVVFFADPDAVLTPPGKGQRVRVVARFYKIWSDRDAHGSPTDYPLFVARHASLPDATAALPRSQAMLGALLLLVVLGLPVLIVLRRSAVKPLRARRRAVPDPADTADQLHAHLPRDPAAALEAMDRRTHERHDESPPA